MKFLNKSSVRLFALFILISSLISCDLQQSKPGKTIISGAFPGLSGKTLILSEVDVKKTIPLDTVVLTDNGEFRFRLDRDSAGIYLLKADNRNYITLVLDNENKVKVYSDKEQIRSDYRVDGSVESQNLAVYESTMESNKKIVDSLILKYNQGQSNIGFSLVQRQMDEEYEKVFNDQKEISKKFIMENCGSLASLLVLNRRFGQRKILTEDTDGEFYLMVDSCLSEKYPGNKHLMDHKRRIEKIKQQQTLKKHREQRMALGNKAPDITLEDPNGKSVSLHSLQGRQVLVYFWASWDKNSRQVNKEMTRVYSLFHKDGFEVYAIALESYRDTWTGAIKADGLEWVNVTDYLNIQSGAVGLFNVPDSLPYFYLLDADMIIRYKGTSVIELLDILKTSFGEPEL